jgi:hypothetical protein
MAGTLIVKALAPSVELIAAGRRSRLKDFGAYSLASWLGGMSRSLVQA